MKIERRTGLWWIDMAVTAAFLDTGEGYFSFVPETRVGLDLMTRQENSLISQKSACMGDSRSLLYVRETKYTK
jgi:hypothetical protein